MTWCKNVTQNIITLIQNSWKTVLTLNQEVLGTSRHQNRNLSRRLIITILLFVIITIPLSLILRDTGAGYQLMKEACKINHLLFMDYLKLLYGNNSSQMNSLVETVWSYSEDIGMKCGIDKCAVLEL